MRILHIISSLERGGRERQLYELLKGMRGKMELGLVILHSNDSYGVRNLDIRYLALDDGEWKKPANHFKMLRFVRDFKPQIIHYWDHISFFFALEARMFVKTALVDGSIRYAGKRKLSFAAAVLKKMSFAIASRIVSNSHAGLVVEKLNGKRKAVVIHNGIDFGRFKTDDSPNKGSSELDATAVKIVMVASFRPAKDHMTLIQAAETLCHSRENVQFILIGDGPTMPQVETAIPDNIRHKVVFLGKRTDIEKLLRSCHIGVLLSTNAEGLSNSLMEYMASGLPVVATRAGGTPELVIDGETGYLVDTSDLDMLVSRLSALIDDPGLREKLGKAGRLRIESHFTLDTMIDKHMQMCHSLVFRKS